jgi:hypothetical protein
MTDSDMEALFRQWWKDSFPQAPPGPHALRTHLGWGRFLLELTGEHQQQREVER